MQLAAAADLELVGVVGFLDLQRDVVQGLAHQAVAQLARGQELAAAAVLHAGERRIVDLERHADGRLVHREHRQLLRRVGRADRVGDAQVLDAADGDDVARIGLVDFQALQAQEAHHLHDLAAADLAFAVDDRDLRVALDLAALDAADADDAHVVAVAQRSHAHLERAVHVHRRRWDVVDDRLEKGSHVPGAGFRLQRGVAVQCRGIHGVEVQLLVRGAEAVEQVEGLVEHPARARAGAVDLVHDHDRLEAHRERLLGDEARLRHRAVHRVHQDQHRVDHRQHALDLASEVGVARGVDDVDAVFLAVRRGPADGGVLGKDGDATFLFQVVAVHHAFGGDRALAEGARLLEQLVNKSGLAVVDVGDDGDVAELGDGHGGSAPGCGRRSVGEAQQYSVKPGRPSGCGILAGQTPAGAGP